MPLAQFSHYLLHLLYSVRLSLSLSQFKIVSGKNQKTQKQEMLLSPLQTTFISSSSSPFNYPHHLKSSSSFPNFFPSFTPQPISRLLNPSKRRSLFPTNSLPISASVIEAPLLWAGRICLYYALLRLGLAGSQSNPFVSDLETDDGGSDDVESGDDMGFSKWLEDVQGKSEKEATDNRKQISKWHPTTKGTLKRNYRLPSNSEGKRILRAVASLLSEDDHFTDAASHKGCQIRRESAHGESVCCNNVRALFDELPTPHIIVEITPFPAGPLTESDYKKAEKLERVLKSSPSV